MVPVDQQWYPGAVRVRAKAIDPLAGLTGHAYIAARNLNKKIQRIERAPTTQFIFCDGGSVDFLSPDYNRRYFIMPAITEAA